MKKFLALFLVLLLTVFTVACNSNNNNDMDDSLKADYFIEYNGVKLEVGAEVESFINKLGTYKAEDGEACGTGEKDVIYTLAGLELESHVSGEIEKLRKIRILDDTVSTFEGITIGDDKNKVIDVYGDNYEEGSNGAMRFVGVSSVIEFHFNSSGNVSNIYIKTK